MPRVGAKISEVEKPMEKSPIYSPRFKGLARSIAKELENGMLSISPKVKITMNKMGTMIHCCAMGNNINDRPVSNTPIVTFVSLE